MREFVRAVDLQDYVNAEALWNEMNETAASIETGADAPSAIHLLPELRTQAGRLDLSRAVGNLPPEYERPQYVS